MTAMPITDPYSVTNRMLNESGFGLKDLRGGQYGAIVEAVRSGDFDIQIARGSDGKADVTIGGVDATHDMFRDTSKPDGCPEWMPNALCESYSKISGYLPNTPNAGSVMGSVAKAAGYDELGEKLEVYGIRITLIILAIVIIGIGIWFSMQGKVSDAALKIAKEVL